MDSGLLILNKPAGISSRYAVDCVERLARPLKAGHAGTLDPLATGVLVVCVGAATRLIEYVQRQHKEYHGTFLLGRSSTTEDVEGDIVELADPPIPTLAELQAAAARLVGRIMQRPPAYSALKIGGQRAYDLARRGKEVQLEPRPIDIYRCEVTRCDYPEFELDVHCGSGTYVRSLGRDLAESLGTAAVMSGLVRSAIGAFDLDGAICPKVLTAENWRQRLLPMSTAVAGLPQIVLSAEQVTRIHHGLVIERELPAFSAGDQLAALDDVGNLVAIVKSCSQGTVRAVKNF